MRDDEVEQIELQVLIDACRRRHGIDFAGYSRESLLRRFQSAAGRFGYKNLASLLEPLLHDEEFVPKLLSEVCVSVTRFFRDTDFFRALRNDVIPYLATFARPKIWHAGCATGEEVYSMAILLEEAGLLSRAQIYATDLNLQALSVAKRGVYRWEEILESENSYRSSGGTSTLSSYFVRSNAAGFAVPLAMAKRPIREQITWSQHDLCNDGVFSEVQLILCRNTLIYFDTALREEVIDRFRASLSPRGIVALGSTESLDHGANAEHFEALCASQRIYRSRAHS